MDVTAQLRKVFDVEQQLRKLKSGLTGAERFLAEQDKDLKSLLSQKEALETQIKTLTAQSSNHLGEVKRLDGKLSSVRGVMDNAQNNKEYKASLTEMNTFKAERDRNETTAKDLQTKVDELRKQIAAIDAKREDREKIRKVAAGDRDARHGEVADKLAALSAQRDELAVGIPAEVLRDFQRIVEQRGENAMGAIQIDDLKRMEFSCGVCMMAIPVDQAISVRQVGRVTKCASCQCYLFIDEDDAKRMANGGKPEKAPRVAKAQGEKAEKTPKKDRANAEDIAKSEAKAKKKKAEAAAEA
ncbi:MAG: zinc ribbon domain-containing protein [Phycisphaerae bacterium]